jgi:hypothetical protein
MQLNNLPKPAASAGLAASLLYVCARRSDHVQDLNN